MKKILNKVFRSFFVFAVSFSLIGMSTVSALAEAPNTVKMGGHRNSAGYLGNAPFGFLELSDGTPVYCMKALAPTPVNETLTRKEEADGGIRYILRNGYPYKKITGDKEKDRYITQLAIWWYLDRIHGYGDDSLDPNANLSPNLKLTGENPYGVREKGKALMEAGLQHRNDKVAQLDFDLKSEGSQLSLTGDKKYYQSGLFWVTSNAKLSELMVSMKGAPEGSKIVDTNGNAKETFAANEKMRVLIPVDSVTDMKLEFSVGVGAKVSVDTAYVYKPSDRNKQDVAVTVTKDKTVAKSLNFQLVRTGVKISKQDITSHKELSGATLVVKDSKGIIIDEWVSTNEPHYIYNLPEGIYTLEETLAPEGYEISKEIIEFEITKDGLVKEVVMYNSRIPEVPVPDTGVNDGMLPLAGASMMILGFGLVYRYAKKHAK